MHKKTASYTQYGMRQLLDTLKPEVRTLISTAQRLAGEKRLRAYLVGGFVRDLFLGVSNLDLDIMVEGDGIEYADALSARLNARCIHHKRFGTATLVTEGHLKIDIASSRKETYPEPASLPEVKPGSILDDLARRDFSINAMAVSVNSDDFGMLIDVYGGCRDLKKKRISVLHENSFVDDPTRILRAIRFEQRLAFSISSKTLRYLSVASRKRMLQKLNLQRVRDEIMLMLQEKNPVAQMQRLGGLYGFSFLHPRISFSSKTRKLFESIELCLQWFSRNFSHRRQLDSWLLYCIALFEPLSASSTRQLAKKLALRRGEEKRLLDYKKSGLCILKALQKKAVAPSRVFGYLEPHSYEVILFLVAKAKNATLKRHVEDFFRRYNGIRHSVSGRDLSGLGITPGPLYAKIFRALIKARLDGKVRSKKEELVFVRRLQKSIR
jgi:tRNA nucleotidyltransferase (CCA-adding enzyme)